MKTSYILMYGQIVKIISNISKKDIAGGNSRRGSGIIMSLAYKKNVVRKKIQYANIAKVK